MILRLALVTLIFLVGCASRETIRQPDPEVRRAELAPPPIATAPVYTNDNGSAWPADAPPILADSAIVIDAHTGRVLYQKNADQKRPVASTQKLLTLLVALEDGNLDEPIRIEAPDTYVEPSKLGVKSGEVYTKRQLVASILVKSSNDAAAALARHHSGSMYAFADAMNRKAMELGAVNSHFVNAHGLTEPGQYSTARDMARIAFYAYRNPVIRQYARLPQYTFTFNNGRSTVLKATNKLLERSSDYTGLKTGYTVASGRCLITTANAGGTEVIIVQLGSKTQSIFEDAVRLKEWEAHRSIWQYTASNH